MCLLLGVELGRARSTAPRPGPPAGPAASGSGPVDEGDRARCRPIETNRPSTTPDGQAGEEEEARSRGHGLSLGTGSVPDHSATGGLPRPGHIRMAVTHAAEGIRLRRRAAPPRPARAPAEKPPAAPAGAADGRRRALSVSELTERIQGVLETEFLDVWVEGEVSNLKLATSGHWYFSLKDERAQIRAVVWKTDARLIRFRPKDGMKVLARGALRVYPPRGEYQLSVQVLEPLGKGSLAAGVRGAEGEAREGGALRPGAQAAAADAAAAHRGRDLPDRRGAARHPAGAALPLRGPRGARLPRAACRARAPRPRSRRGSARSTASPAGGAST